MRAVVYKGPKEVALADVPMPALQAPTDAIVEVTLAGICGTDLHVVGGHFPGIEPGAVVGHEFVGVVADAGAAVQRYRRGDRVMSADFTACGHCRWCDAGNHWHCRERAFFGTGTSFGPPLAGAQAEYVRVPHADTTLGLLPDRCSHEAALLMGDNLATAWVALERAQTAPGDTVAIIGGGAVGQLTALAAQSIGAGIVVVIEPNTRRRAFAQVQGSLVARPDEAPSYVRQLTGDLGADVVIEAVGGNAPLDLAVAISAPVGRIVSVGVHAADGWQLPVARAFRDELTIGFAIGDAIRVRSLLSRMITAGSLDPTVVIDARGSLEDVPKLYKQLAAQEILKAVVQLGG